MKDLKNSLNNAKELAAVINSREALFAWPITQFDSLKKCTVLFEPYLDLWTITQDFTQMHAIWTEGPFVELDADEVRLCVRP